MSYIDLYNEWCNKVTDKELLNELHLMSDKEKQEAFSGELSFGTAGLRGIMSAGTARMNIYTVYRATEGLARYMEKRDMHSCAITYDSRNNSRRFCELAAATLAEHGITVYFTPECMPTPYLSFMVRALHCDMGVNVTASHNPSQYNGYKVYDESGCQLLDEVAEEVTEFIDQVQLFEKPLPSFETYEGGLIKYTDKLLEELYIDRVLQERLTLEPLNNIKAVYTPLNGAGYRVVPETLRRAGVDFVVVPEQAKPNGDFPTCPYPNPETPEALALAKQLAKDFRADIVIANDPDSDRLGVAAFDGEGYRQLSGNEVGVLLADAILGELRKDGMPSEPLLVKTIVTTPMLDAVAEHYGAQVTDVLTGFKYIGNVIDKLEKQGHAERFVFGFEESCGYLKGDYVRDKDGVVAALLVAECASILKSQGKTLVDRLDELYSVYGHYLQTTVSYHFEGLDGAVKKQQLLDKIRQFPFEKLGSSPVTDICDFLTQTQYDLPRADVLRFRSLDGSRLIVRPSGTEPLIKCYVTVNGKDTDSRLKAITAQTDAFFGK